MGNYTVPTAIVMGAEDIGTSPEVLVLRDTQGVHTYVRGISSLNGAAGVMLYEVVRQRLSAGS